MRFGIFIATNCGRYDLVSMANKGELTGEVLS